MPSSTAVVPVQVPGVYRVRAFRKWQVDTTAKAAKEGIRMDLPET